MTPTPGPGSKHDSTRRGCVVFGELLCDLFAPHPGTPIAIAEHLVPHIGGAPANVAVQLARLGQPVQLLSAVGDDPLGERVLAALTAEGVGTAGVVRMAGRRTGLTLVEVESDGERRFHPWREKAADQALEPTDLDEAILARARILHTGTVTLRTAAGRRATEFAQRHAREHGAVVSLDVNLRYRMFPSREGLHRLARGALRRCDVVKATDEEARALFAAEGSAPPSADTPEMLAALARRMHKGGPRLVMLTRGEAGALLSAGGTVVEVAASPARVVDATGAGDAFCGAALAWLADHAVDSPHALSQLDGAQLEALGAFAARAGAAATEALGATTGMVRGATVAT